MTVLNMDCVEGMKLFPDAYFDSIVTDPPYELTSARPGGRSPATEGRVMKGFMGMEWDGSGIAYSVEMWREALRVLKPGGHLLAFSGSRTYHRMVCAIEDAGFEIRDQIMWVYGSGFPKSLDVSKAIDKAAGAEREKILVPTKQGNTRGDFGVTFSTETHAGFTDISEPVTDAARQWQGWGTALKPAHEPIVVARKPLIGTVAANVLAHGTGALNIDGCRVENPDYDPNAVQRSQTAQGGHTVTLNVPGHEQPTYNALGRWPANLIHDGSGEVLAAFPQTKSGALTAAQQVNGGFAGTVNCYGTAATGGTNEYGANEGSAARFFYCAKASKADRNEGLEASRGAALLHGSTPRDAENLPKVGNHHPTVKPTDLMRYLCRLVTPPGGLVLDPFTGSGSTGKACALEGFAFIGFELSAEYTAIATARISEARK